MTDQEPTNAHLLEAIKDLKHDVVALARRTTTIENARAEARSTYDANWSDVRTRLERIEYQTTRTNGRMTIVETIVTELGKAVAELREWKAYMSGVAASFSWWKPAVATIVAAGALWLVTR